MGILFRHSSNRGSNAHCLCNKRHFKMDKWKHFYYHYHYHFHCLVSGCSTKPDNSKINTTIIVYEININSLMRCVFLQHCSSYSAICQIDRDRNYDWFPYFHLLRLRMIIVCCVNLVLNKASTHSKNPFILNAKWKTIPL